MITKYDPLKDPKYMSKEMKIFFRKKLINKLKELQNKSLLFDETLQEANIKEPDFVDQSCLTEQRLNYLAYYNHGKRQFFEIEQALQRIYSGNYGYLRHEAFIEAVATLRKEGKEKETTTCTTR